MKVAVDITPLLIRSAGVKGYLYHWLRQLRRNPGGMRFETWPVEAGGAALDHERSLAGSSATVAGIATLHAANHLDPIPVADWSCGDADVFHASNLLRHPPRRPLLTATIHDLTCWRMPQFHTAANVEVDRLFAESTLRRAAGIIAVSENTRRDAVELLGIAPEKITTIHSGVATSFFDATEGDARRAAAALGLQKPYALFTGTIEPRKNLDLLLDAWEALRAEWRESHELVIAGPEGWRADATAARIANAGAGVRRLGYVPEPLMAGLTKGAAMVVYPSLYEGFGFPVAQAMAAGVAVVTSNVSSLPEIAGDGALLVDPHSEAEIASAMTRLLESAALRSEVGRRGRERAEEFRWERAGAASLRFFARLG
jgi:glycosyltransferase involved in cell wall biosynthesis